MLTQVNKRLLRHWHAMSSLNSLIWLTISIHQKMRMITTGRLMSMKVRKLKMRLMRMKSMKHWRPWRMLITRWVPLFVVVACAVSEHRSRAPVESCGVVYCTPQAQSLFLESCGSCVPLHKLCHCFLSHGTLCCVSHCVCVLSSLSIVLLCIYTAVDWEPSPQSHSLHCSPLGALSLKGPLSRVFNNWGV